MKSNLRSWPGVMVFYVLPTLALLVATSLAKPAAESLKIEKHDGRWVVSLAESALTLKIPDADAFKKLDLAAGDPRYFNFVRDGGVNFSGWFEQSYRYEGLLPFWKLESARFYASPLTAPQNVIFGKIGPWELVVYDLPVSLEGHSSVAVNIHAELAKAGTWIDLHLSKGSSAAQSAAVRQELIELVERVHFEIAPGAVVSPQEIANAVADLTDQIDGLDDQGYAKALVILTRYLADLPAASYPLTSAATPWMGDSQMAASSKQMLTSAFIASLIQDDLQHRTEDRLYRGWRVVLKYYGHYTDLAQAKKGDGVWSRSAVLDPLLEKEKAGQLKNYAQTIPLLRKVASPEVGPPPQPKS